MRKHLCHLLIILILGTFNLVLAAENETLTETQENPTAENQTSTTGNETETPAAVSGGESPGGGEAAPAPAPTSPPPTTTTTINPLDFPCKCLGDPDLLADETLTNNVLRVCRQHSHSRVTSDLRGRVSERYRCGSRTPSNPRWTWDSVCNCTAKEGVAGVASKGFLTESEIKDMDANYRWETYNKVDKYGTVFNTLLDPRSREFLSLKRNIEARLDGQMVKSATAISKGFVRNSLILFTKGEGNNVDTTTTTTSTTTTTTTTTTAAAGGGGGGDGGDGDGGDGGVDDATATNDTVARRKRNVVTTTTTTTTTTTIYYKSNYVKFLVETQFLDENTTLADFQGIFTTDVVPNVGGIVHVDKPAPVCKNDNLTDIMPYLMDSMEHDKPIVMLDRTDMCSDQIRPKVEVTVPCFKNATNTTEQLKKKVCNNETADATTVLNDKCTNNKNGVPEAAQVSGPLPLVIGGVVQQYDSIELSYGQDIDITCKNSIMRPSLDIYDLDPYDGKVTSTCQYDGTYSVRTTQLAQCVTVCDQYTIPTPDVQAGLRFTGVKRVANNMKLEAVEKMVPEAFIWAGDALVYECEQPEHGIRGGVDTVLDMYTCQADTATYNTPRGLNTEREDEQEPWPLCQPQVYMIINAAQMVLNRYDLRISNRYKLIRYEDDDAVANLKIGPNHFLEVTLPWVSVMFCVIMFVLLCARNDSLMCRICAAKERNGYVKEEDE